MRDISKEFRCTWKECYILSAFFFCMYVICIVLPLSYNYYKVFEQLHLDASAMQALCDDEKYSFEKPCKFHSKGMPVMLTSEIVNKNSFLWTLEKSLLSVPMEYSGYFLQECWNAFWSFMYYLFQVISAIALVVVICVWTIQYVWNIWRGVSTQTHTR